MAAVVRRLRRQRRQQAFPRPRAFQDGSNPLESLEEEGYTKDTVFGQHPSFL